MRERKAVASTALRPVICRAPVDATVLGSSLHAIWLAAGDEVVVVTTAAAVRLPNAAAIAIDRLPSVAAGTATTVGGGRLALPGLTVSIVRWWDPRPRLPPVDRPALRLRVCAAYAGVAPVADRGLGPALAAGDRRRAQTAALGLLGDGAGLTPFGDDVVAGALGALVLLGAGSLAAAVAGPVLAAARRRTTALSAALLRHAARGEVAAPVGRLLQALAGRGDPVAALGAVLAIGHSSGRGLAHGARLGAAAA